MNNKKKGIYNVVIGILGQMIIISLGIVIPRLVLVQYGSEVNGLLNSVNQIFTYVSLLEAGVGTASIQALYKPIAQDNKKQINAVLSATNVYYKKTGHIYFLVVIVLAFFYPLIIKSELSNITIFFVFFFTGMGGAISFWFQGKFRLYLEAEGKNYILISINTITYILQSISKIVFMVNGYSIVFVQASYFLINLLQMLVLLLYIKIRYQWINVKEEPDFAAISQKNSVLIHQISSMIFNNTDVLILSFFCGLKTVSIYSMYNLIISNVMKLISQVLSAFSFKLGQTYAVDKKAYRKLHDMYEVFVMILVFSCFSLVYVLIIPFMELYTAGVKDINYIDKKLPILFILVQLLSNGRSASNALITYAGHFKKTQMRSIIESTINITISIISVQLFGIYGVLVGTIAALLYRANDMILYTYKYILCEKPYRTYRRWFISFVSFFVSVKIISKIPVILDSYMKIFIFGSCYMVFILFVHIFMQLIFEREVYGQYYKILKKIRNK